MTRVLTVTPHSRTLVPNYHCTECDPLLAGPLICFLDSIYRYVCSLIHLYNSIFFFIPQHYLLDESRRSAEIRWRGRSSICFMPCRGYSEEPDTNTLKPVSAFDHTFAIATPVHRIHKSPLYAGALGHLSMQHLPAFRRLSRHKSFPNS